MNTPPWYPPPPSSQATPQAEPSGVPHATASSNYKLALNEGSDGVITFDDEEDGVMAGPTTSAAGGPKRKRAGEAEGEGGPGRAVEGGEAGGEGGPAKRQTRDIKGKGKAIAAVAEVASEDDDVVICLD